MRTATRSLGHWAARAMLLFTALSCSFVYFPFEKVRPFHERMILIAEKAAPRERYAGFAELAAGADLRPAQRFDAAVAAARQGRSLDDSAAALRWYELALKLPPANPDFRENLELEYADLLVALRQWQAAREILTAFIDRASDPRRRQVARDLLVTALRQSGAIAEAAQLLAEIVTQSEPAERLGWQMQLIECWTELGRRTEALALLREAQPVADRTDDAARNAIAELCRRLDCRADEL